MKERIEVMNIKKRIIDTLPFRHPELRKVILKRRFSEEELGRLLKNAEGLRQMETKRKKYEARKRRSNQRRLNLRHGGEVER